MQKVSDFIRRAKVRYGEPRMSDRKVGELLGGYSSSQISDARLYERMSDHLAASLEDALGVEPGVIVLLARTAREKHPDIRRRLESYAKNVLGKLPEKIGGAIGALLMAACLLQPQPSLAARVGGDEGIRTLDGVLSPILP